MSELRTDFKDEILQEGETHRVYDIKRKGTDEIVESDIYLEKAYTPLQEGNEFGAKEVNEIHGRLNGLASQNLLINGDFKINQRGKSSYVEIGHALDMIHVTASSANVFSPVEGGGIKFVRGGSTQAVLRQYNPLLTNKDVNSQFTLSFLINTDTACEITYGFGIQKETINLQVGDNLIVKTFTLNSDDIVNDRVDILLMSISSIPSSNAIIIFKYARIDKGSIAYPHIAEDETIALLRCQKFFIRKGISTVPYYKYGSGEDLRLGGEIPSMESVPTVNITGCFSFDNASAINTIRSVKSVYVSDTFYLDARVVFAKPMHPNCYGVILICEISCEPK